MWYFLCSRCNLFIKKQKNITPPLESIHIIFSVYFIYQRCTQDVSKFYTTLRGLLSDNLRWSSPWASFKICIFTVWFLVFMLEKKSIGNFSPQGKSRRKRKKKQEQKNNQNNRSGVKKRRYNHENPPFRILSRVCIFRIFGTKNSQICLKSGNFGRFQIFK